MLLYEKLSIPRGVTAVIGSGGKTTLLRTLSRELPGTVLLATTTHILPFEGVPLVTDGGEAAVRRALAESRVVCVGTPAAEGKLTPDGISDILERGNRTEAGPTVPPGGLYMTKLWYNEPVGLDTDPTGPIPLNKH